MLYKILKTCIFYIRWIFVDVIALRVKYKIYCTLPTLRLLWYIFSLMYIVGNIDSYQTKNKHLCWKLLMGFTTSCTMHLFYLFFSHALLLPASRHTNEIYLNCRWWGKFLWRKIASWLYNTYNKTQGQIYFLLFELFTIRYITKTNTMFQLLADYHCMFIAILNFWASFRLSN